LEFKIEKKLKGGLGKAGIIKTAHGFTKALLTNPVNVQALKFVEVKTR